MDEFHDYTASANLGYAFTSATQLRVTARNSDAAAGTPGAFNFYGIANAGKRSNQDIYLGASLENRTIGGWHNLVRYGMTRKREEDINFYPAGIPLTMTDELLRIQYRHPGSQRLLGDRAGDPEFRRHLSRIQSSGSTIATRSTSRATTRLPSISSACSPSAMRTSAGRKNP